METNRKQNIKDLIHSKLEECYEGLGTNAITDYVFLLVCKRRKSKEELVENLTEILESETEPFVDWLMETRKPKKVKCKFWPNCDKGSACEYFHPSEQVFPN